MHITKATVAEKLAAYLHHELMLAQLVDWAETALMDGELDENQTEQLAAGARSSAPPPPAKIKGSFVPQNDRFLDVPPRDNPRFF